MPYPAFKIVQFKFSKTAPKIGETVSVDIVCKNNGPDGTCRFEVKLDGVTKADKTDWVATGSLRSVSLTVVVDKTKTVTVTCYGRETGNSYFVQSDAQSKVISPDVSGSFAGSAGVSLSMSDSWINRMRQAGPYWLYLRGVSPGSSVDVNVYKGDVKEYPPPNFMSKTNYYYSGIVSAWSGTVKLNEVILIDDGAGALKCTGAYDGGGSLAVYYNKSAVPAAYYILTTIVQTVKGVKIDGATVAVNGQSKTTDGSGRATFNVAQKAIVTASASKKDYKPYDGANVQEVVMSKDQEIYLLLESAPGAPPPAVGYNLEVTVRDAVSNVSLAGAEVTATSHSEIQLGEAGAVPVYQKSVLTDGLGKALFKDISKDSYDVRVYKAGYKDRTVSVDVLAEGTVTSTIELQAVTAPGEYPLTVIVQSKLGVPVMGATVKVDTQSKTTDAWGYAEFAVKAGSVTATATRDGYAPIDTSNVQSIVVNMASTVYLILEPAVPTKPAEATHALVLTLGEYIPGALDKFGARISDVIKVVTDFLAVTPTPGWKYVDTKYDPEQKSVIIYFQEVASPYPVWVGGMAGALIAVMLAAGIVIFAWSWINLQTKQVEITKVQTTSDAVKAATDLYLQGKITKEQYDAILAAIKTSALPTKTLYDVVIEVVPWLAGATIAMAAAYVILKFMTMRAAPGIPAVPARV